MKKPKIRNIISVTVIILIFFACSGVQENKNEMQSDEIKRKQELGTEDSEKNTVIKDDAVEEIDGDVMSMEEAEILDMMITTYEQNAKDLINWSVMADKVSSVNEANDAMLDYIEVQKRFNDKVKEIEDYSAKKLGDDHKYSIAYEVSFQSYLSDPIRTQRSKNAVNSTMRLIRLFGEDEKFKETMEVLGEMNRHRMKELDTNDKKN